MNTTPQVIAARPSIVKDAIYGLVSATVIGLVASMTFILTVLLLSSQAFASSDTNALTPAPEILTAPMEREYFFQETVLYFTDEDSEQEQVEV